LYKIEVGEGYSNITLDKELNHSDLSKLDRALASSIVYGVLTYKLQIDEIVKTYSSIKLKKISPWIINILRMGIYQIAYMDKIPISAAVNESVNLAKRYGHSVSSGFVNAILRKISKDEVEKLKQSLEQKEYTEEEKISILTSHPLWMVKKLLADYDKEFVVALLNANNENPGMTIRTNTLKTNREDLLKLLILKGIDAKEGNLPDSIIVDKLSTFDDGFFVVQDEAAQLACLKLDPQDGEHVLDACSSPGGKTTYIATLMHDTGRVDAWDIHEHRVELVKELSQKLGISNINASLHDATKYESALRERYDRVLLDVPCSGIGVIRKKPDIKWTRQEEDLEELQVIQEQILECGAQYLKTGGTLVYSTCTVFKDENERQIKRFLEKHHEYALIEEIKLYPNVNNTDGFYIAKLSKH
jgi:16S rRNA (cytosine967-C5)-methyltransferase